jgi:hypothetical protein
MAEEMLSAVTKTVEWVGRIRQLATRLSRDCRMSGNFQQFDIMSD